MPATYTTVEGDILERICNRHYPGISNATVAVLAANRGLAKLGAVLPKGITITLPVLTPPADTNTYTLW